MAYVSDVCVDDNCKNKDNDILNRHYHQSPIMMVIIFI